MFFFLLWTALLLTGQTRVKISAPRLELHENEVHIYYDILDGEPQETYEVSLDVRDESGNTIQVHSLAGDHGTVEKAGENKQIVWDLEADNIYMNAPVLVKISARVIAPPLPEIEQEQEMAAEQPTEEEQLTEEGQAAETAFTDPASTDPAPSEDPVSPATDSETASGSVAGSFNRTSLMLQSLAIPGLGLSRVTGKPHWLRAVAGYGCIGGAIALNRAAMNTFNAIDDAGTSADAESAFKKSVRQDRASEALAITAIGIWVTDAVWTWFGLKGMEGSGLTWHNPGTGSIGKVSVGPIMEPLSYVPMVQLKVQFKHKP